MIRRCDWAGNGRLMAYHDLEWGVPLHDDSKLFEFLILEGAQAGLSWDTILKKRDNYRRAFDNFDAVVMAGYGEARIGELLADSGIIRNRLKITSAVMNSRAYLRLLDEFGSFDTYLWKFVGGRPIVNRRRNADEIPAVSKESEALSRDLKSRGFSFVGPTICYAFMQAVGMVNDHQVDCFRHAEIIRDYADRE